MIDQSKVKTLLERQTKLEEIKLLQHRAFMSGSREEADGLYNLIEEILKTPLVTLEEYQKLDKSYDITIKRLTTGIKQLEKELKDEKDFHKADEDRANFAEKKIVEAIKIIDDLHNRGFRLSLYSPIDECIVAVDPSHLQSLREVLKE
jgi:hypothetical protein